MRRFVLCVQGAACGRLSRPRARALCRRARPPWAPFCPISSIADTFKDQQSPGRGCGIGRSAGLGAGPPRAAGAAHFSTNARPPARRPSVRARGLSLPLCGCVHAAARAHSLLPHAMRVPPMPPPAMRMRGLRAGLPLSGMGKSWVAGAGATGASGAAVARRGGARPSPRSPLTDTRRAPAPIDRDARRDASRDVRRAAKPQPSGNGRAPPEKERRPEGAADARPAGAGVAGCMLAVRECGGSGTQVVGGRHEGREGIAKVRQGVSEVATLDPTSPPDLSFFFFFSRGTRRARAHGPLRAALHT